MVVSSMVQISRHLQRAALTAIKTTIQPPSCAER
jgi:hypothetical protein